MNLFFDREDLVFLAEYRQNGFQTAQNRSLVQDLLFVGVLKKKIAGNVKTKKKLLKRQVYYHILIKIS